MFVCSCTSNPLQVLSRCKESWVKCCMSFSWLVITLAPACVLKSGGPIFRWSSQAEYPDFWALSITEAREGNDKLRRAICGGSQWPVCSSSTFTFQGFFSSCPVRECPTTPPPLTTQPLSHSAEPGQCFARELSVLFHRPFAASALSLLICGARRVQAASGGAGPQALGLSQEDPCRTGIRRASFPSAPTILAVKWEPVAWFWHSQHCAFLHGHCLKELWVDGKEEENLSGAFSPFYQQRDLRAFLHLQSLAMLYL